VVLLLVGCGGGVGSSITPPNPPPPAAPSSVSPTSVTFGNTLVETTAPTWSVTYENDGSGALAITAISASGDYAQSNNCGNSLASGTACTINPTFTPGASGPQIGSPADRRRQPAESALERHGRHHAQSAGELGRE